MILRKKIFIFIVLVVCSFSSLNVLSQSRFEIDVNIGYSKPLLEAYGSNLTFLYPQQIVMIDGKRLLVSNNLGTKSGYSVQTYLKYNVFKKGYLKGLFNIGYNALYSIYKGPGDDYGIRIQSFSVGTGLEVNPLGNKKFYPALFGLLRMNLIGGETFFHAGLDFLKVTPRFGYTAGINLNYKLSKKLGLYFGGSYSYDNAWNKKSDDTKTNDIHTIVLMDEASPTNGLANDRRIAYSSFYLGLKFYLP